eukprot:GDKJ01016356.1.p1 GENE.GDKJ01016356.1~~GDKJ01016356.1.p1  ORF type:complete len:1181 (-),score=249.47 GDKJ01016356.1:302-3622(-)
MEINKKRFAESLQRISSNVKDTIAVGTSSELFVETKRITFDFLETSNNVYRIGVALSTETLLTSPLSVEPISVQAEDFLINNEHVKVNIDGSNEFEETGDKKRFFHLVLKYQNIFGYFKRSSIKFPFFTTNEIKDMIRLLFKYKEVCKSLSDCAAKASPDFLNGDEKSMSFERNLFCLSDDSSIGLNENETKMLSSFTERLCPFFDEQGAQKQRFLKEVWNPSLPFSQYSAQELADLSSRLTLTDYAPMVEKDVVHYTHAAIDYQKIVLLKTEQGYANQVFYPLECIRVEKKTDGTLPSHSHEVCPVELQSKGTAAYHRAFSELQERLKPLYVRLFSRRLSFLSDIREREKSLLNSFIELKQQQLYKPSFNVQIKNSISSLFDRMLNVILPPEEIHQHLLKEPIPPNSQHLIVNLFEWCHNHPEIESCRKSPLMHSSENNLNIVLAPLVYIVSPTQVAFTFKCVREEIDDMPYDVFRSLALPTACTSFRVCSRNHEKSIMPQNYWDVVNIEERSSKFVFLTEGDEYEDVYVNLVNDTEDQDKEKNWNSPCDPSKMVRLPLPRISSKNLRRIVKILSDLNVRHFSLDNFLQLTFKEDITQELLKTVHSMDDTILNAFDDVRISFINSKMIPKWDLITNDGMKTFQTDDIINHEHRSGVHFPHTIRDNERINKTPFKLSPVIKLREISSRVKLFFFRPACVDYDGSSPQKAKCELVSCSMQQKIRADFNRGSSFTTVSQSINLKSDDGELLPDDKKIACFVNEDNSEFAIHDRGSEFSPFILSAVMLSVKYSFKDSYDYDRQHILEIPIVDSNMLLANSHLMHLFEKGEKSIFNYVEYDLNEFCGYENRMLNRDISSLCSSFDFDFDSRKVRLPPVQKDNIADFDVVVDHSRPLIHIEIRDKFVDVEDDKEKKIRLNEIVIGIPLRAINTVDNDFFVFDPRYDLTLKSTRPAYMSAQSFSNIFNIPVNALNAVVYAHEGSYINRLRCSTCDLNKYFFFRVFEDPDQISLHLHLAVSRKQENSIKKSRADLIPNNIRMRTFSERKHSDFLAQVAQHDLTVNQHAQYIRIRSINWKNWDETEICQNSFAKNYICIFQDSSLQSQSQRKRF